MTTRSWCFYGQLDRNDLRLIRGAVSNSVTSPCKGEVGEP
jgi:hypothetical protein